VADDGFERWRAGAGVIRHRRQTQEGVRALVASLDREGAWDLFAAADRLASAAMWLVVHQTYAKNVFLDGRALRQEDFKSHPEGHTGGALNMVPAYVGYLLANALTGVTRAWAMGQGHCVAAIDATNVLVGNTTAAHAARYDVSDAGLTRYVRDFYAATLDERGEQDSPLGSHVNAHTAGGVLEGGYLGFLELQYVHMPLPGERLVAFLSDGAFEEQRGSDWAPRWWRAEDSGLVTPIMIANGRRIDQRTTMSQQGGIAWFLRHLRLNSFDPLPFDGRDPAAFAWAIVELERRLEAAASRIREGRAPYPVALPYGIAIAPKGAGFYGEGTNLAHNLPLGANPHTDGRAVRNFQRSARRLWIAADEIRAAVAVLTTHDHQARVRERDHVLATRHVKLDDTPPLAFRAVPADRADRATWTTASPMAALDETFLAVVRANPQCRPRVGNPDEMRSNRMIATLEALKFRVTAPESGIPEAVHGAVITALNEEAVVCAALGNKGGINLVVTYEAFAPKMHGALRQEVTFADHLARAGRPAGWLSVPLVLTSHTWENAKNEQSHQDPAMAELMLGEASHVSRVLFPPDANSAAATLRAVYRTQAQIWTLVVPKAGAIPDLFSGDDADRLLADGAMRISWAGHHPERPRVIVTAVGAYQLGVVLRASVRLADRDVPHAVVAMLEPGRFRRPRSAPEAAHLAPASLVEQLYPRDTLARVFVTHTRPDPLLGVLTPLATGRSTIGLGFANAGGTLDLDGLLFVNGCSWAHCLDAVARVLDLPRERVLEPEEIAALDHQRSPAGIVTALSAPSPA
jgi:phosphoketolase